ncbi:MAG: hypothetical protein ACJ8LG_03140 [Massilia sp.]
MSRTSTCLKTLTLCLLAHAGLAAAQQPAPPSDKPPRLERIEPGSDVPATTIPPRGRTQIKEKKQGGQVTEVEVTSGGSHYTMKPNNQPGTISPGDAQSSGIRAPQWQVLEFDLNAKRKAASGAPNAAAAEAAAAPAAAEASPPPRPAPAQQ